MQRAVARTQRNLDPTARLHSLNRNAVEKDISSAEGGLFKVGAAWRELQSEVAIKPNVSVIIQLPRSSFGAPFAPQGCKSLSSSANAIPRSPRFQSLEEEANMPARMAWSNGFWAASDKASSFAKSSISSSKAKIFMHRKPATSLSIAGT